MTEAALTDGFMAQAVRTVFGSAPEAACPPAAERTVNSPAEAEEIRLAAAGDGDAFARLMQRYESTLMGRMWRFSRDREVAGELVQDVFIQAYRSLKHYRAEAPFLHWLGRIATRTGYQYWKKQGRQKVMLPVEEYDRCGNTPEEERRRRAAEWVHDLLARLDTEERLILTLHYFEDCSMREIARRMDWNRDMVKMKAMRARRKLREMIEREGLQEELQWAL